MMKHGIYKLLGAAALSFFGFAAQAQDIKLGFNGDCPPRHPRSAVKRPFLACKPLLTTSMVLAACSVGS